MHENGFVLSAMHHPLTLAAAYHVTNADAASQTRFLVAQGWTQELLPL